MRKIHPWIKALLTAGMLVAAATAVSAQTPTRDPLSLKVMTNEKYGFYLVDGKGNALYMFAKDSYGVSTAAGPVLQNWPPALVTTLPAFGADIQKRLVGTIVRADGTTQLTYDGMPLYYWSKDQKSGDTTGQNVNKVWFLVAPDGSVINTAP